MGRGPSLEAGPEPAAGEEEWEEEEWEDWSVGNWVAGTGANLEKAAAGGEADAEPEAESAADGVWWEVVYNNTVVGAGRAMELGGALHAFAETLEVTGALGDGQLAKQLEDLGG